MTDEINRIKKRAMREAMEYSVNTMAACHVTGMRLANI